MVKQIVRDAFFLRQRSVPATKEDLALGQDLRDTLRANRDRCVGMAANMIGARKRAIIAETGLIPVVMFNPVLVKKEGPYRTEEGCLSLDGVRETTRYRRITVEYLDENWQKRRAAFSDGPAQIIQHEMDHLEGILI